MAPETGPTPLSSPWLEQLRLRFAEIAARRVPESVVEDLVHDALGIVLAKGPDQARDNDRSEPGLRWCFNVLRNVIGNYYQKRRDHSSLEGVDMVDGSPGPLASLALGERNQIIHQGLNELRRDKPRCADWLWSSAQGTKPGQLAKKAGLDPDTFYRRLYRCRQALASILKKLGVSP